LPPAHLAALAEVQERLRKGAQFTRCRPTWVKAEAMHLTLVFLGSQPREAVPQLAACVERAASGFADLKIELKGLGVFPDWRGPRVLWVGVRERTRQLAGLRERLVDELRKHGLKFDDKPFQPHLTLARFKSLTGTAQFQKIAAQHQLFRSEGLSVNQIVMFRSELFRESALHTPIHSVQLQPST
jgi:RNA 2',3'-cyclic 3'-phosphodiesterase